jgi:hypothetical protein
MDPTIVAAIIGVVGTVLGTLVGIIITYRLAQQQMSDKEQFLRWRAVFDRRAFKAPYMYHTLPEPFEQAIADIILTVRTGTVRTRKSQTPLPHIEGKGRIFLKNKALRSTMEQVEQRLARLQSLARKLVKHHAETQAPVDSKIYGEIDQERDRIIEMLNLIWDKYGIDKLPLPTTVSPDIYFKVEE